MAPEGGAGGGGGSSCRPSNSRPRPRSPPAGPGSDQPSPAVPGQAAEVEARPQRRWRRWRRCIWRRCRRLRAALLSLIGNDISTIADWGFRSPRGFVFVDAGGSDGASSFWGVGLGGGFGGCSAGVPTICPRLCSILWRRRRWLSPDAPSFQAQAHREVLVLR